MAITSMTQSEREAAKQKVKMAAVLQFTLPGIPVSTTATKTPWKDTSIRLPPLF